MKKLGLVAALIFAASIFANAQSTENLEKAIKDSPAYGIVLLKKAEIDINISKLSVQYKEKHPDFIQARIEQTIINQDLQRLLAQTNPAKLTAEIGRSIVQKFETEAKLRQMKATLSEKHPTIIQLNKELEILTNTLNQILN